jgi:hypothetical protein
MRRMYPLQLSDGVLDRQIEGLLVRLDRHALQKLRQSPHCEAFSLLQNFMWLRT